MTRINTEHVFPPLACRDWDWSATFDSYDGGDIIGRGPTKDRAVADLIEQAVELGLIDDETAHRLAVDEVQTS